MIARCMDTKQDHGGDSMAPSARGGAATYTPREIGVMSPPAIAARTFSEPEYEAEGAAARLAGKTRDDCPYDEATQSLEWRSWVTGFGYAAAELMVLKDGRYFVSTTESPPSDFDLSGPFIPIRVAIENGYWKPRFVTLVMLDEIEKARAA